MLLRLARRRAILYRITNVVPSRHFNALPAETRLPSSTPPWKEPARGGQNLTDRYQRLETSLRGKQLYVQEISALSREASPVRGISGAQRGAQSPMNTFMGYLIPEEPKPPGPEECCMSGCAVCVQDLYVEALDEYKRAVDGLRSTLTAMNVSEDKWPVHIRTGSKTPEQKNSVALSAFEELERQLLERKKADAQAQADSLRKQARRRDGVVSEMQNMYEGMRWMLFSNR